MDYFHVSTSVMNTLRREGLAHSEYFIKKLRHLWKGAVPRAPYTPSSVLVWLTTDNLDMYARKSMTRTKGGMRVKSEMLHALVTERIYFHPSWLEGPPPEGTVWLESDPDNFVQHVTPDKSSTEMWLTQHWKHYLLLSRESTLLPMQRPKAEKDLHQGGRTITQSMPILVDHSTSTAADMATYMLQAEQWFGSNAYFIHLGDYMTFRNLWFNIWRSKPLYNHHAVERVGTAQL